MHYGLFCLLPKLPFKPWPNGTPNSDYLQPSYKTKACIDGWPNGTHKNTQLFQGSLTLVPEVFIFRKPLRPGYFDANFGSLGIHSPSVLPILVNVSRGVLREGSVSSLLKAASRLGDRSLSCFLSKSLVAMAQLLNWWLGPEYVYCIRIRTHF